MNAELKLKRRQLELEQEKFYAGQLNDLLKNPLIEFMLGTCFIGYITRGDQSTLEKLTGFDIAAGTMGAGLTGIIVAQQLAPMLPKFEDIKPLLAGLVPGLK